MFMVFLFNSYLYNVYFCLKYTRTVNIQCRWKIIIEGKNAILLSRIPKAILRRKSYSKIFKITSKAKI